MLAWLLALLHLPIVVDAFVGHTFVHTFKFPSIPYEMGLRHIHSPESFACYKPVVVPGFQLVGSATPMRLNNYSMIEFDFRTLAGPTHARMLTNSANRSNLILSLPRTPSEPDMPFCAMRFDVGRYGVRGHAVTLRGQVFGEVSAWGRILMGRALQADMWEATMRWGYSQKGLDDPNLLLYRDRVMLRRKLEDQ
jgi:hypothetical protein